MQIPTRVFVGIVLVMVTLLTLVIVVGLIRNQVNTQGLVIALTPVITGVLLGGTLRPKRSDDDKDDRR